MSRHVVSTVARDCSIQTIPLSDTSGKRVTPTEPPMCTLVVTERLVRDETQIGALCAAALSRGPAAKSGPWPRYGGCDRMRLKWSSRA